MANIDDLNATLQDVVRAVNNLNETLRDGLPVAMALTGSVAASRELLELCLGIVQADLAGAPNAPADLALAQSQLQAALV